MSRARSTLARFLAARHGWINYLRSRNPALHVAGVAALATALFSILGPLFEPEFSWPAIGLLFGLWVGIEDAWMVRRRGRAKRE